MIAHYSINRFCLRVNLHFYAIDERGIHIITPCHSLYIYIMDKQIRPDDGVIMISMNLSFLN